MSKLNKKRFFLVIDNKVCAYKLCTKCAGRGKHIDAGIIVKICDMCSGAGTVLIDDVKDNDGKDNKVDDDIPVKKRRGRPKKNKEE